MNFRDKMKDELAQKEIFSKAQKMSYDYIDEIDQMRVFPDQKELDGLSIFSHELQEESLSAANVLDYLHKHGTPGTVAQTGGRYFGFVNGGALPISIAVKWLSDVWDQCGGLYLTSPLNGTLEQVCEDWLVDIFNLPKGSVAGFVSGTSMANLCGLSAARYRQLQKLGWDINNQGMNGSPRLRVIVHEQVHASIKKTLVLLGFGLDQLEWIPSDAQGRIEVDALPELDKTCIVLLQAGNVNTGAFDDFNAVCDLANAAGSWVHIDGAFGLWAQATTSLSYLTKGIEKASSWSTDGHKTLNTPYDSGIILCKDKEALISSLQASGEYIIYSDKKDSLLYTPEMSKRSRAIELWACLKYLGKQGIDDLITELHLRAKQAETSLKSLGFIILNEVVFNQVLVTSGDENRDKEIVKFIQDSGEAWLGGTIWQGKAAIRVSVCSWATSEEDINHLIALFAKAIKE